MNDEDIWIALCGPNQQEFYAVMAWLESNFSTFEKERQARIVKQQLRFMIEIVDSTIWIVQRRWNLLERFRREFRTVVLEEAPSFLEQYRTAEKARIWKRAFRIAKGFLSQRDQVPWLMEALRRYPSPEPPDADSDRILLPGQDPRGAGPTVTGIMYAMIEEALLRLAMQLLNDSPFRDHSLFSEDQVRQLASWLHVRENLKGVNLWFGLILSQKTARLEIVQSGLRATLRYA